ncbi:MAG: hypothetical protein ACK4IX_06765, partial [Candidatus Sericytochromatia bacterium]
NGNPPNLSQLKDIKPEDIQKAKELFQLDDKSIKRIEWAKARLDVGGMINLAAKTTNIEEMKNIANTLMQQGERTPGRKIGERLDKLIKAYESSTNGAEQIINLAKLKNYTNIFTDQSISRGEFNAYTQRSQKVDSILSSIVRNQGGGNNQTPIPPEKVAEAATQIAKELGLDAENTENLVTALSKINTSSKIEETRINVSSSDVITNNQESQGGTTNNTVATQNDPFMSFFQYQDPRITDIDLSKENSTASLVGSLQTLNQKISTIENFDKDVFTRDELNSVQGRNEFLKGFNKEFGEIMAREYQEAAAEAEVSQSSNETITQDELGAAANDSIRKADEMEAVAVQLDQFDPSAASIDKLLENLREIVKNLDKDVIEIISKVRRKDKQDKKTETNAVDNKSTRELLNTLKSQLKETHTKSPEEQKALASKLSVTVKSMSNQLKSEAEYLRDKQRELGNDYAINYRPERLTVSTFA